jgi:hypothetical protein
MNKSFILLFLIISFFLSGCLTFHRISYELSLEGDLDGKGIITINDIRSEAENDTNFEEDKHTLFEYILKSETFLSDMLNEGKEITSRNLFIEDELLNGKVEFNFDDIREVEGIAFQDGFYFLTMESEDSIHSTNGEIIKSDDHKRLIWGNNIRTLKFEMIAADYDDSSYRELAPFYKE